MGALVQLTDKEIANLRSEIEQLIIYIDAMPEMNKGVNTATVLRIVGLLTIVKKEIEGLRD